MWDSSRSEQTNYLLQWNVPERPPLLSDHLTKIPIGSSVSQIAISETSCKRPPKADIKPIIA